jgi:hypothetical protein
MGYFVTDPSLIALANAGLPPDEQVGGYYQMDEHEIARAAARPDLSGRDLTAGRKSNATERPYRANCKHPPVEPIRRCHRSGRWQGLEDGRVTFPEPRIRVRTHCGGRAGY